MYDVSRPAEIGLTEPERQSAKREDVHGFVPTAQMQYLSEINTQHLLLDFYDHFIIITTTLLLFLVSYHYLHDLFLSLRWDLILSKNTCGGIKG